MAVCGVGRPCPGGGGPLKKKGDPSNCKIHSTGNERLPSTLSSPLCLTMSDLGKCASSSSSFFIILQENKHECSRLKELLDSSSRLNSHQIRGDPHVVGGSPGFAAGLSYLDLKNSVANSERYSRWAGSVKYYPSVIKQQLTPLHELVKEIPCASVKRHYLKQAIEEYINENHPCRCRPCQNSGKPVVIETKCYCVCKPYTFGAACELGALVEDQPGVTNGGWSCWSTWSSCAEGRRSRTRSCSNPYPTGSGKWCIGDHTEYQQCDDEELEYLRGIEPHCFDTTVNPEQTCPPPPSLENGFVQDPRPLYPIGSNIVYSCSDGYYIDGDPVAKCGADLKWQLKVMECRRTVCLFPALQTDVQGAPFKSGYRIGEKVALSCSGDKQLDGPATIQCDSSLNWSPDVKNIKCKMAAEPEPTGPSCKPWEKVQQSKCTCKMPYECRSSLDICATDNRTGRNVPLTVCKAYALECLGRKYTLTSEVNCKTPNTNKSCSACHLWEKCDDQQMACVCRVAEECQDTGISICVQINGNTSRQTMSECEAGVLRCRGENVSVVNLRPCDVIQKK
nr:PREDICTED: complement component C7-like [Latimeria chalumnae]|eukprot:XP_006013112.2 PREDICTED: complement component C7-like [Latimeria chalumnae]